MQVRLCTKGYLTPKIYGGKKFSVPYLQNFNRLKIFIIPDILDPVLQPDPTFSILYTLLILPINNV
jgi:hypothetical protein